MGSFSITHWLILLVVVVYNTPRKLDQKIVANKIE